MTNNFLKSLGPGLMWAGAAVGVSHLVQSTRAGALYGFDLVWLIILANLIKYPFFEFAPRYTAATGKSLIHGYARTGKWAIWLYGIFTLLTMFTIQAAVTMVTAGILKHIFGWQMSIVSTAIILLMLTALILYTGKFTTLDKLIKFIIILLTLTTMAAVVLSFMKNGLPPANLRHFDWVRAGDLAFLIALAGWMPAPIDVSVWHSLWSVEKQKTLKKKQPLVYALLDFKIGYYGTAVLALFFLALGALVMYPSGQVFAPGGAAFAGQLISMYTASIGSWAYFIIAIAAFTTMFSTTVTCMDAYARVLNPTSRFLFPRLEKIRENRLRVFWMTLLLFGSVLLIARFTSSMKAMVDLATTLSFVTAPVMAFLNYKAVTDKHVPEAYKPGKGLLAFAVAGIILLGLFSLLYLFWRFA